MSSAGGQGLRARVGRSPTNFCLWRAGSWCRERSQRWARTWSKVLECQVSKEPSGGPSRSPFSLTIRLQLVGELKEEILVVNDLELAHVGLGLQMMRRSIHLQAWGTGGSREREDQAPSHTSFLPPASVAAGRYGETGGSKWGWGLPRAPPKAPCPTVLTNGYSHRGRLRYLRIVLTFSATECWELGKE